jgi:uncharacterized cupredoxin-like copper-binding protein
VASRLPLPGRRFVAFAACLLFAGAAAGCGTATKLGAGGQVVNVTERDFAIKASPKRLSPGEVVFHALNRGPDEHELIVVRARDPKLMLRSDGMTVSEEGLKSSIVGTLEPGQPGSVRQLRVNLKPGRYVLMCNMSGHYMGGMHTVVTVQ